VTSLAVVAPDGLGEVAVGSELPALAAAIGDLLGTVRWPGGGAGLSDGDVVVVSSKVLSKAEGRVVRAADRERAITAETVRVVATRVHERGVTRIVENRQGIVMAAAGVDSSNTSPGTVLLLPEDPDASARRLRAAWAARFGRRLGVLVTDTLGRPWRFGVADVAIGAAGLLLVRDLRGSRDPHGNPLEMTVVAVADEIAAAAELVKGKTAGRPVAVVRGVGDLVTDEDGPGAAGLNRTGPDDMFSLGTAEALARGRREAREAGEAAPSAGPGRAGGLRP
jgi:coenzyme F420-0:L-glutamate ligase/coenzyme F420-1:gamma-L-glutamate ligase